MSETEKLRVLIVDDEPLARRGLQLRLEPVSDVEVTGEAQNGREAIKAIKETEPDLVFLDIQMPGIDGFGVVRALLGGPAPLIVFVTAFDQYAIDAFEANALDYMVKPVEEDRLEQALHRARAAIREKKAADRETRLVEMLSSLGAEERDKIKELIDDAPAKSPYISQLNFRDAGKVICLQTADIEWIDAAGDYMCIHAGGVTHIIRETMKKLAAKLDPSVFQRVHRSAIVNVTKVKELHPHANGEYFLKLENGGELKLSRSYKDVLTRFL
ncbi:MAG: LytTR family DNA-binding domain-containing protein [Pseudomonadota bacterium]